MMISLTGGQIQIRGEFVTILKEIFAISILIKPTLNNFIWMKMFEIKERTKLLDSADNVNAITKNEKTFFFWFVIAICSSFFGLFSMQLGTQTIFPGNLNYLNLKKTRQTEKDLDRNDRIECDKSNKNPWIQTTNFIKWTILYTIFFIFFYN